jgi:hypothetical protein
MRPAAFVWGAIALSMAGSAAAAPDSYTLTISQSGSSLVASGDGAIDTAALSQIPYVLPGVTPALAGSEALLGLPSGALASIYYSLSGPSSFGASSTPLTASTGSGDTVGLATGFASLGTVVVVPSDYASGAALSSTDTFGHATIASAGLTPGTYTYDYGAGDTFTVQIDTPPPPPPPAHYTLLVTQSGSNVIVRGNGEIDTAALAPAADFIPGTGVTPLIGQTPITGGIVIAGSTAGGAADGYVGSGGPGSFITGVTSLTLASSGTGDIVGLLGSDIIVEAGYGSDAPLSSTDVYDNQTIAGLNLVPGTYVYDYATGETFTLQIGGASGAPEPSAWALAIAGFALVGARLRSVRRGDGRHARVYVLS